MTTPAEILSMLKEKEVKFVDLRFTDTRGKEQHVTVPAHTIEQSFFIVRLSSGKHRAFVQEVNPDATVVDLAVSRQLAQIMKPCR